MSGTKWFSCLWRGGVCVCVCVRVCVRVCVYTSSTCSQAAHGSVLRTAPSLSLMVSHGWELGALWTFPEPVPGARWAHAVLSPQDLSRAAAAPMVSQFPASSPEAFCLWTVCSKCHLRPRQQQQKCWPVSVVDNCFRLGSDRLRESRGEALEPGFQGDII